MSSIAALFADRRRSQQGSVLSGVLIITAFIAIISGALTTELSTNFLLSNDLMIQANDQATVNSAVALALDHMQTTPLVNGCPALSSATVNGESAAVAYSGCGLVVDRGSPQFSQFVSSGRYTVDGTHAFIPRGGVDLYMVGDSAGYVSQYTFGNTNPSWRWPVQGLVTGPPLMMTDYAGDFDDITDVVPLTANSGSPPECAAGGCADLVIQDTWSSPTAECYMPAGGAVTAQPAQGVTNPTTALFGDGAGNVFAYVATRTGGCASEGSVSLGSIPVVAGPVVFGGSVSGQRRNDEVYVVTSNGTSSTMQHVTFTTRGSFPPQLVVDQVLGLPWPNAVGLAVDATTVPARVAVSFAGGNVALVRIDASFAMSPAGSQSLSSGIGDAPAWCCGSSPSVIGVAQTNRLSLLNGSLGVIASYGVGGATLSTSPVADAAGDWFVGASDGYVYELPAIPSPNAPLIKLGAGQLGNITSSAVVGRCTAGVCVYVGSQDRTNSIVQLDARSVVMTACISTTPPLCSGQNPRLWVEVEVGSSAGPRTVRVEGWSYYSP